MYSSLQEVSTFDSLAEKLILSKSLRGKLEILNRFLEAQEFRERSIPLERFTLEEKVVLKAVVACNQGALLRRPDALRPLLDDLLPVERFYRDLGGIVGYQAMMLVLLHSKEEKSTQVTFHSPKWWDLTKDQGEKDALAGIMHLPMMAEMYPLGGAGDRLSLVDEHSGEALPAATLEFCGKTLLQGLIEDLQAREFLYFKLTGKVSLTPVAIMTSQEKDNHRRILDIFEKQNWFGRPKESFRFFKQPLVPVMDDLGKWCFKEGGRLLLKPGGHGVIWKLAQEAGIFEWFKHLGRTKILLRQVNNPVAGCDFGLLALSGIGCTEKKDFGFASCPRLVGSHEGMNVLIETKRKEEFSYSLSNVEYCEFQKRGIVDASEKRGSPYSLYPSNTNILFADLKAIQNALLSGPIPGMLINKKRCSYYDEKGKKQEKSVARLESMMQNIADHIRHPFPSRIAPDEIKTLRTFLTYNERKKTISCTKRKYVVGSSLLETPEGCFLDILDNAYDLLKNHCNFDVPKVRSPAAFFSKGPSFLFSCLPALGPLYSVVAQKLKGGHLTEGSSLDLQLSELDAENIHVDGSVSVIATHQSVLNSNLGAKCFLKNVSFVNRGINFSAPNCYWKRSIDTHEHVEIVIKGSGEFHAESVTFHGSLKLVVEDGMRVTAKEVDGEIRFTKERISSPTWNWNYCIKDHRLILQNARN